MQRTCVMWLTCTVVIYFLSSVTTAYGRKCSGRWAIHACYGGNGKRSSPPSDSRETLDRKPYILGKLLLRNQSPIPELLSNYPDDSPDMLQPENVYPNSDSVMKQQVLERVNSVLSDMLLNRQLLDREEGEPYY